MHQPAPAVRQHHEHEPDSKVTVGTVKKFNAINLENSARREKVQCSCRCKSGLGELSVRPSSYRGSKKGDRLAEALGTSAHHGWVCKPTGRNTCEARAGLEREGVSADLPELQGRPLDLA
jgi:hypothetical protein